MSDDEEKLSVVPTKKTKTLRFGSLAEVKTVDRIMAQNQHMPPVRHHVSAATDYFQLDNMADPHKDQALVEFERRRRARLMTLPTDDMEVRTMLRMLSQPICLFGEDRPDRRERLRTVLSLLDEDQVRQVLHREEPGLQKSELDESTWYHEGPESLRQARIAIAKYSLPKAKERLEEARRMRAAGAGARALRLQETHKWVRNVTNCGSQIGDTRPISFCDFSPDSELLATSSWTGLCKLWRVPALEPLRTFRGHAASSGCIRFHPEATRGLSPSSLNLASCGHDGSICLWSLESDLPLHRDLNGHAPHRVSRLAFHPSGRFLATCCDDHSWRLTELAAGKEAVTLYQEVLFQEGHSKPVFDIAFQQDGSLALTGGMDAYGRVWDLRTGRCIMFLEGHLNHIVTVSFAPNGYFMASGSADNTVKMWDLRMRRQFYTIPAHQSVVSRLQFDADSGDFMVTCSYDQTVKIWTNPGWQQLKVLSGHDSKVMCASISPNGKCVASSSFDRTIKLWAPET